jgi:hypothetical protein
VSTWIPVTFDDSHEVAGSRNGTHVSNVASVELERVETKEAIEGRRVFWSTVSREDVINTDTWLVTQRSVACLLFDESGDGPIGENREALISTTRVVLAVQRSIHNAGVDRETVVCVVLENCDVTLYEHEK